jgi:hypothetical protein
MVECRSPQRGCQFWVNIEPWSIDERRRRTVMATNTKAIPAARVPRAEVAGTRGAGVSHADPGKPVALQSAQLAGPMPSEPLSG